MRRNGQNIKCCSRSIIVILPMFLCSLIVFSSCLDEISLDGQENPLTSIMIRGKLTLGSPSIVEVEITKLSDFIKFEKPEPIEDATVFLSSESGGRSELTTAGNGTYWLYVFESNPDLRIKTGDSYKIELDIPGFGKYESELEPMIEVPQIEKLEIDVIEKQLLNELENIETKTFVSVLVDTDLVISQNTEKAFLRWELEGTYRFPEATIVTQPLRPFNLCYYFDDLNLNDVAIFDGNSNSDGRLERHVVLEEPIDHRYYRGFYVNVVQQSISEGAFNYWSQVKELINRDGGFFESTPGRIESNVKSLDREDELVFGYFYATAEDSLRIYISPSAVGFPTPFCREVANIEEFRSLDDECRSCLAREGSTIVKPDFWID